MIAAQVALAVVVALLIGPRLVLPGSDFMGFWAAHQVAHPYDMVEVSRAAGVWLPYGHPPTFLLLTLPFRWLADFPAYLLFIAVSAASIVGALRRPLGIAILAAPAVLIACFIGQSSLVVAAPLFLGFASLKHPRMAGACFGLAACIKPQIGLLVPIALVAAGAWRTIGWAAVTGIVLAAVTALVYGPMIWVDWLQSLPAFVKFTSEHVSENELSVPGPWKIIPLSVGAVGVWRSARRNDMLSAGLIAVAASLLGSMHAMTYEQAVLAPFALALAADRRIVGLPFLAFLACPLWPPAVAFAGAYALGLSKGAPTGGVFPNQNNGKWWTR